MSTKDEAIRAAAVALANSAKLPEWMQMTALGRDMTPLAQRAVEAAYPIIAQGVRDDAVANERLKGWTPFGTHVDVVLPADRMLEFSDNDEAGIPRWERIVTRPADSVPVATPTGIVRPNGVPYTTDEVTEIFAEQQHSLSVATPEPTPQPRRDLIVCSHCLLTPAEIDATDHHSGGWCPGRVATPPAEPAETPEQNYRRHLLSLDPSPEVRAALDDVIPPGE